MTYCITTGALPKFNPSSGTDSLWIPIVITPGYMIIRKNNFKSSGHSFFFI